MVACEAGLGWHGTAGHGCGTTRQCHSPHGPSSVRGWEQALGVGDEAGKGTRQGETQQILGTQADSRVQRLA